MKISIITVTLNSKKTILYTLNSIITQSYKNIEHIIVDGGSTDGTLELINKYNFKNRKIFRQTKSGIYNAMNLGILKSTGDFICILNSDDIFNSVNTIKEVVKEIKKNPDFNIYIGSVAYFNDDSFEKINRYYSSQNFKIGHLYYGIMPPHPATFVRRKLYLDNNLYKENFKIAADFEFFLKNFLKKKKTFKKIKILVTRMKTGGISGKDIFSYIITTIEIIKSFRINYIEYNLLYILLRFPAKILQFFFINKKKLNCSFKIRLSKFFYENYEYDFQLIKEINKINLNKNFILSAMNLAFLGYYIKGDIKKNKFLINWPDGIFSKIFNKNIKKIPGREIILKIKLHKNIKEIVVLGKLNSLGKKFLEDRFKIPIKNVFLPYGSVNELIHNLNLRLKKNQLLLITLPTPKQEIIADYLSYKNKNFKIICIGGSIAIASGTEKAVPKKFINYEFLWRLRYDTLRRIRRLIVTFIFFFYGFFINKKLKNLKIKIVKS
jgi:glycosyltransferase involved in cell wall biosynthesis